MRCRGNCQWHCQRHQLEDRGPCLELAEQVETTMEQAVQFSIAVITIIIPSGTAWSGLDVAAQACQQLVSMLWLQAVQVRQLQRLG